MYGRVDPRTGSVDVFDAPRGPGAYGICTAPDGSVYFASLASSYVGKYMESADGTVKGVIDSVKVYSDGIIATTTDGGKILVQAGITVADEAPSSSS